MDLKTRLERALVTGRRLTELMLSEIDDPADWLRRPVPGTNHAMWIAGHLASADNGFTRMVSPDHYTPNAEYKKLFGKGSVVLDDADAYPTPETILAYMRERRAVFLDCLQKATADDLERETPPGAPPFMYDLGAVFQMAAWHESLHAGQLSIIHRLIGKAPIADRPMN